MRGLAFVVSALYLLLLVAFVMALLEDNIPGPLWKRTLLKWGNFLLLLVVLGIVVQILTWIGG